MVLKKALFVDENRNQIEPRTGFLQFYEYANVLPVLAQNKLILHIACT